MNKFDLSKFQPLFSECADKRAAYVNMARTAEAAERYEDMCQFMKAMVEEIALVKDPLSVEERNLLSVAYKNVIGTRRASWRTLQGELENAEEAQRNTLKQYNQLVEKELVKTCEEVLAILDNVRAHATEPEERVFYLKMSGDYYRYLAESVHNDPKYPEEARKFYEKAYEEATAVNALVPTHPIRLGLALNYSVCHYEILKDKGSACTLAKSAFDDAIAQLDKLDESDYKDSTLIMQLLRDNLTLWSANDSDGTVQVEDLSDDEN